LPEARSELGSAKERWPQSSYLSDLLNDLESW